MKKSRRQLLPVEGFAVPVRDLDLTSACVARLGGPAAGQKVFRRVRPVKDSFQAEPVRCVGFIVARAA